MAKKRVHEIAKEKGIPSKEVIAKLQAAGLNVKAAASSVDEADIEAAFSGKKIVAEDGRKGRGRPSGTARPGNGKPAASTPPPKPAAPATPPAQASTGQTGGAAARSTRPTRDGGGAAAGGRRRRVVIDSQASRRAPGPPPQQQAPPRRRGRRRRTPWVEPDFSQQEEKPQEDVVTEIKSGATVKEVSESLGLAAPEVIKKLMELGEMATLTQTLSDEAIEILADSFEKKIQIVRAADEVTDDVVFEDDDADLIERPPVVTVMGHVDHGKTSLLDAIREAEVAAGEAGGITQHIGAYQVHHGDHTITFLDTPGHEAFTAMRARGASVTDISVVVVAADDGVMPQTTEAIDHSKAAEVPIVVAVNKIDKEGADPQRVRGELAQQGLTPADWGGDTEFVDVSAKARQNLDELLETLTTLSDIQELKANPNAEASGVVIESRLDPGRGPVVSLLISRGTLKVGDAIVAGEHPGRARAMHDYTGERIKQATPGTPVEILGFDGVPEAGEQFRVVGNEREARRIAGERANRLKTEALADEIAKLPQEEVTVNLIHTGVGGINESDVMLASASNAVIIGFNVRPVGDARAVASREGVEIRGYSVIYKVVEELRAAMEGLLEPEDVEETVGTVEIRATFKASKVGTIAGSMVTDGSVRRGATVRLVRDGTIVYDGRIGSLRRFKEDVREVTTGMECGIVLENFADVKEGDQLEVYETRQVEKTLQ